MTPTMRGPVCRAALAFALGVAAASGVRADEKPEKGGPPGTEKLPKCVDVRGEARYSGYGYDHLVEVNNRCDKAVDCTVATDVNPQPQSITVKPGEKSSVQTFRGSPASAFKPDVACKLAS